MQKFMVIKNLKPFKLRPLSETPEAVNILIDATTRVKRDYWMSAGTALGLYRDHDLMPNDTDIDIAMIAYKGIYEDLKAWFEDYDIIREVWYHDEIMQFATRKNDIIFDIYIHRKEGDNYVNFAESGKQSMPAAIYDDLRVFETKYGPLPFPGDIEKYLTIRYGDWQTPQNKKPNFEKI